MPSYNLNVMTCSRILVMGSWMSCAKCVLDSWILGPGILHGVEALTLGENMAEFCADPGACEILAHAPCQATPSPRETGNHLQAVT